MDSLQQPEPVGTNLYRRQHMSGTGTLPTPRLDQVDHLFERGLADIEQGCSSTMDSGYFTGDPETSLSYIPADATKLLLAGGGTSMAETAVSSRCVSTVRHVTQK
jgi:hypothetical protein